MSMLVVVTQYYIIPQCTLKNTPYYNADGKYDYLLADLGAVAFAV